MQYKCQECNDTGGRDKIGAYFDCNACDTATTRRDLNDFVKSLTQRSTYPTHPEDVALAIHQRALAMAPKQEVSGKYLNDEEVKQLVAALAMGADNTEALRSEAPRRLIAPLWAQSDCIAAALRIFQDFPAAPAAANGALTDEHILLRAVPVFGEQDDRNVRNDELIGFTRAILAAAGTDAALVEAARNVVTCFNDPHTSLAYVQRWVNELAEVLALSGAKGN